MALPNPSMNFTPFDTLPASDLNKIVANIEYLNTKIVNIAYVNSSTVASGTETIPFDDTIPQISEGKEYMTLTYTPTSATNQLFIEVKAHVSNTAINNMIGALFINSTVDALAVDEITIPNAGFATTLVITYGMVAGTTSAMTFRFRAGGSLPGTTTFNGESGARKLGGAVFSTIKITEYKA